MEWHYKARIQEFYQDLKAGVVLSELEKMRKAPGGKRRIKEVMSRGGEEAARFQNIRMIPCVHWLRNDSDVDLCFELDRENRQGMLMLPSVPLENLASVGVSPKHFEYVRNDLKNNYNGKYEKVIVEQRRLSL